MASTEKCENIILELHVQTKTTGQTDEDKISLAQILTD